MSRRDAERWGDAELPRAADMIVSSKVGGKAALLYCRVSVGPIEPQCQTSFEKWRHGHGAAIRSRPPGAFCSADCGGRAGAGAHAPGDPGAGARAGRVRVQRAIDPGAPRPGDVL